MKVAIVGSGYVGLVTGTCLAEKGHQVTCVDIDPERVERITRGDTPIHERGLDDILRRNIGSRLTATTDLARAVAESDLSLIAVGTPFRGTRKDLGYVEQAARDIGRALRESALYHVVVVKSTVPPGTTDDVVLPILESESGKSAGRDFGVGMNPEFLREGEAVEDFMHPDRLVFGALDERTADALEELYRPFPDAEIVRVSNRTAEMIKYASNSLFATLISFSNEIGNLCAKTEGVDVLDVLRSVHLDRRVSPILEDGRRVTPGLVSYLGAGCGYGGSCFPKDVRALVAHGREEGLPMDLLDAVTRVNDAQPGETLRLLRKHFANLRDVRVAVLGLTFKPGTDDTRESPAIPIIRELRSEGAVVATFDPMVGENGDGEFRGNGVRLCGSLEEAVDGTEAVILVTRWPEFSRVPDLVRSLDPQPVVVDGRRMLARESVQRYEGIGL